MLTDFKYYTGICLKGMRKTAKNLSKRAFYVFDCDVKTPCRY
jgi:hypothetical protein